MLIQAIYLNLTRKSIGILLTLFTRLRIGELYGLQMLDISLCDNTITVNKTVQRIYDKLKKTSYIHIGAPKTKSSQRTIPFPLAVGVSIRRAMGTKLWKVRSK